MINKPLEDLSMKKALLAILAVTICLATPEAAVSFNNQFQVHFGGGSGDYKEGTVEGEASAGLFGIGYSRYFTPLENTDSPYALREFLQHPSKFYLDLDATALAIEEDLTTRELAMSEGTFTVGGMLYLPSKTGLGAAIRSKGEEYEETISGALINSSETSTGTFVFSINQYIGDKASIGAELEGTSSETENSDGSKTGEYEQSMLIIRAEGVINNMFHLKIGLGGGEREYEVSKEKYDVGRGELVVGVYPNQKLGITLSSHSEVMDKDGLEERESSSSLALDYYFSDHMHLETSLGHMKMEDEASDLEIEASTLDFLFGFLY
jgi:hypothetical protein